LQLLAAARTPIAGPSANRSGRISPTTAAHVDADFGAALDIVLDGGPCEVGLESTVLDLTAPQAKLLRPGGVPADEIERVLGLRIERPALDPSRPSAPGQLESHYAPTAPVRLDAREVRAGEALLAFGPEPLPASGPIAQLSAGGDLLEAAAHLFAALRELDAHNPAAIAVMPIPNTGLGEAINDRLRRAAAPRPLTAPAP
jgi:L-threonylcarbamoyladenylate synthase